MSKTIGNILFEKVLEGPVMLSYDSAYDLIYSQVNKIYNGWCSSQVETLPLKVALGRVLASDIYADIDQPSFNSSAMDGIAIQYNSNISKWKIISELKAGISKDVNLNSEECAVIMTGAEIPENADTVIPVEALELSNEYAILKPGQSFKKGEHIRYKGEDLKSGKLSIPAFTPIHSTSISTITACGLTNVSVIKKPGIGILSTGEELIEPNLKPERGQVRATNLYALEALCREHEYEPEVYGIIPDEIEKIKNTIVKAAMENEIVLTTGGASVGKFDFIQKVLNDLNANIHFNHSNIKPGKPMFFATLNVGKRIVPIFCLPGNPVSSFVNFSIYINPILRSIFYKSGPLKKFQVMLGESIKKKDSKTHFVRGKTIFENAKLVFYPIGSGSSADMQSLSGSDSLGVIGEEIKNPEKGEIISCIKI